ncbi:MAG: hypothetical protein U0T73_11850 [Chitinophagales bacterium]
MTFVNTIYLSWRQGRGNRRILVAVLKRVQQGFSFEYLEDGVNKAKKDGFVNYPEFADVRKTYTDYLKEAFSLRLMPSTREEKTDYLRFWNVPFGADWFDELAFTQGRVPSDNFEFLGVFLPGNVKGFVSDLAGLSHSELTSSDLQDEEILNYKIVPNSNARNEKAVEIFTIQNKHVGYIKEVHNEFFLAANNKVRSLRVKGTIWNGGIKACFVEIKL